MDRSGQRGVPRLKQQKHVLTFQELVSWGVEALLALSKGPWLLGYRLVLTLWQLLIRETHEVFCYRPPCDMRLRVAKGGIAHLGRVFGQSTARFLYIRDSSS